MAPGGFWLSFVTYSLHILVSAGYQTLAFTMIQNSVESDDVPKAISSYNLFTNGAQTIAPIIFGFVAAGLNAKKFTGVYGPMIAAFILVGYLPSAFFYYRSGQACMNEGHCVFPALPNSEDKEDK